MATELSRIIERCNSPKKSVYNILTFPTHERYESQLCKTGHNFYSFHLPNQKKWNLEQCQPPENYHILPESNVCDYIKYDFILAQSKFWQFQVAMQINQQLNLPVICLEHTVPLVGVQPEEQIRQLSNMFGNMNIFISEYSQKAWNIPAKSDVIHHGIDTEVFKPYEDIEKQDHILTVANDFINRDYCLNYNGWMRIRGGLKTKLVGNNPGIESESIIDTTEMAKEYNRCGVYLNTSTLSPIPTSLLEAMACGCAVVSTATCMIPEVIQNGVNGIVSNDETELRNAVIELLNNPAKRQELGNNARQTILNRFSEKEFIDNWNQLFDFTYEVYNK